MELSDIHIKEDKPELSLVFEKALGHPRRLTQAEELFAREFHDNLKRIQREDFMIQFNGQSWRGRYDKRAVDGNWYRLRRTEDVCDVDNLPSPMPKEIREVLMSPVLSRGGLVHICGGTGCGKTTTGTAVLVSRLKKFGGVAYTVEDPPEKAMNGWHGDGYCTQTWVAGETSADWGESMRGVLRSQPTGTNVMLYVGEVRDAETARMMLRAASNGFLVISTGFGDTVINGIDTFMQLLGRDHAGSLASVLRVIVHQKIEAGRFTVNVLTSESPSCAVASMIRSLQLPQLQTEITYQRNQLLAGTPLLGSGK